MAFKGKDQWVQNHSIIIADTAVVVDGRKQVDWAKSYIASIEDLQKYVKAHHTTGPSWNKSVSDRIIYEYFQEMCGYYYFTLKLKLARVSVPPDALFDQ